jgi:hypothetical protein
VDADPRELIAAKHSKSLPPFFGFGESKVTTNLIRLRATVALPSMSRFPLPKPMRSSCFATSSPTGLGFLVPTILDRFSVKIHHLSPSSFLELSKFLWVMKTFKCNFGADVFTRLFELVIEPDIIKLDDGQHYEAHYTCCTFNTRRQNTRKGLTRIQIAPCCKTNFSKD